MTMWISEKLKAFVWKLQSLQKEAADNNNHNLYRAVSIKEMFK